MSALLPRDGRLLLMRCEPEGGINFLVRQKTYTGERGLRPFYPTRKGPALRQGDVVCWKHATESKSVRRTCVCVVVSSVRFLCCSCWLWPCFLSWEVPLGKI